MTNSRQQEKLSLANIKPVRLIFLCVTLLSLSNCSEKKEVYRISGNIEDPQNEIANTIAVVLNKKLGDSVVVRPGIGSLANLDSLEKGVSDFGVVDNYSRYSSKVSSVIPLYSQVLHILHKRTLNPVTIKDLLYHRKVFAGIDGSGTNRFVRELIDDFGIDTSTVEFVPVIDFFQAEVIFSFTDLLSQQELIDLKDYKLFSIDQVDNLGRGSLAESICIRHPQFEPYIIARNIYGDFSEFPVLTVKVDAILVCRTDLNDDIIYDIVKLLHMNRQDIASINPLLYNFSSDFDPSKLNFKLHPGARNFLERNAPSFIEKHADLLSVIISILVGLASALFSISQWQRARKKNKIDVYYKKLIELRKEISQTASIQGAKLLASSVRAIQEETINLVIKEKLLANESFSIFLNLSRIIMDEISRKEEDLIKSEAALNHIGATRC